MYTLTHAGTTHEASTLEALAKKVTGSSQAFITLSSYNEDAARFAGPSIPREAWATVHLKQGGWRQEVRLGVYPVSEIWTD